MKANMEQLIKMDFNFKKNEDQERRGQVKEYKERAENNRKK